MINKPSCEVTQFGFKYGPAEVSRIYSDDKGAVWIEVKGARGYAQVRVTKTGLVRVEKQA